MQKIEFNNNYYACTCSLALLHVKWRKLIEPYIAARRRKDGYSYEAINDMLKAIEKINVLVIATMINQNNIMLTCTKVLVS